jgi:hypothetical protein
VKEIYTQANNHMDGHIQLSVVLIFCSLTGTCHSLPKTVNTTSRLAMMRLKSMTVIHSCPEEGASVDKYGQILGCSTFAMSQPDRTGGGQQIDPNTAAPSPRKSDTVYVFDKSNLSPGLHAMVCRKE